MKMKMHIVAIVMVALLVKALTCKSAPMNKFLPVLKMPPSALTQEKVTALLGQPVKVDQGKRGSTWYYEKDNAVLQVKWRNEQAFAEKISFSCKNMALLTYDPELGAHFKEGQLKFADAVSVLGTPGEMQARKVTQVLHYKFKNSMLRLFFRNQVLVDYTLVERGGYQ
ncbi:MAG: hypothetical protein EBZ77_07055 [Chitinophagia bacterium]|nr:hypothetical protein [Chitinophagia bacterium]